MRGVERTAITLHVGYGTFKPVRADDVEDHTVDPERYAIGDDAARGSTRHWMQAADRRRRHDDHAGAGVGGGAGGGAS